MSTTRIFTALLAVGAALAKPIAKAEAEADALAAAANIDLGPGIPTASGLTITSLSYFGDGCPDGSLTGEFCPETSSFNVSIKDLKAILQDGQPSDDASCHIEVGFKTEAQIQLNLLQGDFYGSVYLEEAGMTALAHSSVSFAGNAGGTNIPWLWYGPIDTKAVYEHNLLAVFVSQCSAGGDFLMLVDLVLHVTRGPASSSAVGFVDIDQLTGALSQAYVLQPSPCGKTVENKPPSSETSQSGGSYGKEEATKKKTEKTSSGGGGGSSSGGYKPTDYTEKKPTEEEKKTESTSGGGSSNNYKPTDYTEKKPTEEEKKTEQSSGGGSGYKPTDYTEEKKPKPEEEKKTESGGGSGTTASTTCGEKCKYVPCSEEEEKKKVDNMNESEKKAYYESKTSYELDIKLKYEQETKYGYGASSSEEAKKQENAPEASTQKYDTTKGEHMSCGTPEECKGFVGRTRLMQKAPEEEKKDDSSMKCKRDANGDCQH
ncbi:hypothetical protein HDK64DRAFT_308433 [Phyllosticta capitalensis]